MAKLPKGRKEVGLYGKNHEMRIQDFPQVSSLGAGVPTDTNQALGSMNLIYQIMRGAARMYESLAIFTQTS